MRKKQVSNDWIVFRFLTFLLYLNDVEEGGHTVFPKIVFICQTTEESALVRYNMYSCGKNDQRTPQRVCPVLIGNKKIHHNFQPLKSKVLSNH